MCTSQTHAMHKKAPVSVRRILHAKYTTKEAMKRKAITKSMITMPHTYVSAHNITNVTNRQRSKSSRQ